MMLLLDCARKGLIEAPPPLDELQDCVYNYATYPIQVFFPSFLASCLDCQ